MSELIGGGFATASQHWYDKSGAPAYTVIGKNGKERNTTLRDAREHGLVPSVTTILRTAAAPQLEKWKRDQVLMAALTLPRIEGESSDAFIARVEQDWQAQGRAAADRGTAIHAAIERHYAGLPSEDYWEWVKVSRDALQAHCGPQAWLPERSFACPIGFGGKTDLHSDAWVVDAKSKDGPAEGRKLWDEEVCQLAAYRHGLGVPTARCAILHVDRNNPSAEVIEASEDDLQRGWAMFTALLAYWQAKNKYRP